MMSPRTGSNAQIEVSSPSIVSVPVVTAVISATSASSAIGVTMSWSAGT
jgi:hypothetical protein